MWWPKAATKGRGFALSLSLIVVAAFIVWASWVGQDANVDRMNYHTYVAYALVHWRYDRDVMPGGPQTYLNPVPYLIPQELGKLLPARSAAWVLAALQSSSIVLIVWIMRAMTNLKVLIALATLVAGTAALVLAEIGTSFEELLLSVGPLGSILILVRSPWLDRRATRRFLVAGLLTGQAVGASKIIGDRDKHSATGVKRLF